MRPRVGTSGVLRWVPEEASRDPKDEQDQPAEKEETQTYDTVGKSSCPDLSGGKEWAVSSEASREIRLGGQQSLVESKRVSPVLLSE